MVLSREDIKTLIFKEDRVVVRKIKLSIGEYYAKYCNDYDAFRELLGKKVFDLVGIKCPEYKYVKEVHCVISEDVEKWDKYYNPFDLNMNGHTLMNVKDKLYGKFTNSDEICFQVDLMHFIDILFANIDRHVSNFGFSKKEDGSGYLVVFDNAEFLYDFEKGTRPMAIDDSDALLFVFTRKQDEALEFFSKLSEEEKQYFLKVYEMFSPMRVLTIINSIEKENSIKLPNKLRVLKDYIKNYIMVGKVLKKKDKVKKK